MADPADAHHLEVVFGRAFLVELAEGHLERAQVFARAFLTRHAEAAATA